ncbi:hypothetical protein FHW79_004551 [Azospirillum sp. OGB3]|uniref:hypothetical protein n=1 Tax=Azospirillum sp. OGB3 TaxID=2587012 RepID=UPI0016059D32|nr:hypothetical protein [Azospirillum sp. OGB3]MBB3266902.1 hypothetical protein [Azospirillum sp. OGB3]
MAINCRFAAHALSAQDAWAKTRRLDREFAEPRPKTGLAEIPKWTFHNLRRPQRTGPFELRINSDVADRVPGRVIDGGVGNCDRHAGLDENQLHLSLVMRR